jgi:hypothetical protein
MLSAELPRHSGTVADSLDCDRTGSPASAERTAWRHFSHSAVCNFICRHSLAVHCPPYNDLSTPDSGKNAFFAPVRVLDVAAIQTKKQSSETSLFLHPPVKACQNYVFPHEKSQDYIL